MKRTAILFWMLVAASSLRAVDWPAESIRLSVLRDDTFLKIGQLLQLDRALKKSESGWSQMRLDLPDRWKISTVEVQKDGFRLMLDDGRVFRVSKDEVGDLSFRLLDGGDKKDSEVVKIWTTYAKKG